MPLRRPPVSVFRIVSAVSCPGVTMTSAQTPRKAASSAITPELRERLLKGGDRRLEPPDSLGETVRSCCRRGCRRLRVATEELGVALLLLARLARLPRDELAGDQAFERLLHLRERVEPVEALGATFELARRLRPAQHEQREQRELGAVDLQSLVEKVPVLRRAAAGPARETRPALAVEPLEGSANLAVAWSTTGSRLVNWLQASRSEFSESG